MKRPRKVAFLDQGEFLGGAEYFSLDFFNSLSSNDIRRLNPIVIGAESPEYKAKLPENISIIEFDYPRVKGGFFAKMLAVWKLFFKARKLKNICKKEGVTQIFTNTPRTHFIASFLKFWGWRGKWVCMFHDFTTRPKSLLQYICKKSDIIISNSIPTRNYVRKNLSESQHKKIRIVENGINFEDFPTPQPPTEIRNILNIGRIDPRKGQKYFIEAADLLLERNPDLQFTIIGSSVASDPATTEYETQIKAFIKERTLKNCTLKPHTEKVFETIMQYDCIIFTPTEPETFGRVVIEALACGKLVIAFDQTGPKETLKNYINFCQKSGISIEDPNILLCETGNAMTLAETIAYFADNPQKTSILTENAHAFVKKHYNLAETKKRMLEILLDS